MDGLIADFIGGACRVHGLPLDRETAKWDFYKEAGMPDEDFWKPLMNREFWADLEPLADGLEMLDHLRRRIPPDNLCILSSGAVEGSVDGKRDWLKKHCPDLVKGATFSTEKWRHAGPGKILVDDHDGNIEPFIAKGGIGVLAPRSWNKRAAESFDPKKLANEVILRFKLAQWEGQDRDSYGACWTDENGNTATLAFWGTEEKAKASLKTLTECTGCINCVYAFRSHGCRECSYIDYCKDSALLDNCSKITDGFNLIATRRGRVES
jgi:hypothetical protein